jgi:hypothetical protein
MKFELEESLRGASDEALLEDLQQSAKKIGRDTITIAEYGEVGKVHPSTLQRRFGSWVKALELSGLNPSRSKLNIDKEELFDNIREVWTSLGRQPRYGDIKKPFSKFSAGTYEKRFGSWKNTLQLFVEWVNSDSLEDKKQEDVIDSNSPISISQKVQPKRRTRREITGRMRFRILERDRFKCMSCGASPATNTGTELEVDHIIPWSKGGETSEDNLQAKCKKCNRGKGNAFDV